MTGEYDKIFYGHFHLPTIYLIWLQLIFINMSDKEIKKLEIKTNTS